MTSSDLIVPEAPLVILDYDIRHRVSIRSPNEAIVKDITVLLAGFTPITNDFLE